MPEHFDDRHRPIVEPRTPQERELRDAVLYCAADVEFATRLQDSRLLTREDVIMLMRNLVSASRAWERCRLNIEREASTRAGAAEAAYSPFSRYLERDAEARGSRKGGPDEDDLPAPRGADAAARAG